MITANPLLGTFYHGVGAASASACYTPQKKVKLWSWQTYWLVQAFFCWFALPIVGAALTIPELRAVLSEAPRRAMLNSFLLGMAYGIGGTAFGVSIRYIGFSLTYAIAVGLSSVLGTLIPPLLAGTLGAAFAKPGGGYVLLGILIGTIGIGSTGASGRIKETALRRRPPGAPIEPSLPATPGIEPSSEAPADVLTQESVAVVAAADEPQFSIGIGLLLSLLAGVLSAFYGFALNAGQPIADVAARHGADVWQGNVIYLFANTGAFLTTLVYCGFLHMRNNSLRELISLPVTATSPGSSARLAANYGFAALTGAMWYGQFFFYNLGHVRMGDYKFSSWALHMTMLVLFSGVIALLLKEWKGSPRLAQALFIVSMLLLVAGVFALTYGNYLGSQR